MYYSTPSPPLVLLIEGVKELDHAHTLMDVLEQHSIPLLQVFNIELCKVQFLYSDQLQTCCKLLRHRIDALLQQMPHAVIITLQPAKQQPSLSCQHTCFSLAAH